MLIEIPCSYNTIFKK